MSRLAGKVAFITGAAGGIGRAVCTRFLAEGAMVVAADIAPNPEMAEHLARASVIACDVSEPAAVQAGIAQAIATFGRLDILCNIAGGSTSRDGAVTEAPDDEFWRAIRLDLFGTFLCCKHALPAMIAAGGGSVINMASMVALMGVAGRDCYTAAKGGVVALTRSMAVEYAPQKIRVNAIAPGVTLTPRVRSLIEGNVQLRRMAERHLLGPPDTIDIAHMAVYLASDESRVVTGQIFPVDGGVTVS